MNVLSTYLLNLSIYSNIITVIHSSPTNTIHASEYTCTWLKWCRFLTFYGSHYVRICDMMSSKMQEGTLRIIYQEKWRKKFPDK